MQTGDRPRTQRLVLTARLKEGARERAVELVGSMPTPLETDGFEWLSVYLSECEVVFLTEAPEAELLVRQILDDPVRGTEIGPPLPDEVKEKIMINRILYTAEATAIGGREGHARASDGRLDVELDVPTEMGGTGGPGTNPEQLFAAGYAACFQSSLLRLAGGRKIDLTGTRVTARVGIGPAREGGFGLTVVLDLDAPGI